MFLFAHLSLLQLTEMADVRGNNKRRQLAVADDDNSHSKRRKLNVNLLQKLSNELSDKQLESAVAAICKDAVVGQTACYTKQLLEFWEEPFNQLPEELLLLILCNAFDTRSGALQLALVCQRWYRLFRKLEFWLPWIRRTAGGDTGVRYLFNWAGLEAAVCATTRQRSGRHELWCYDRHSKRAHIMGYYKTASFNGVVVIKYAIGDVYEGTMENGLRSGTGTQYFNDGEKYVGEWAKNKLNGYGTYHWPDGSYIRGYWKDGLIHGHATNYDRLNRTFIVGNYENDKLSGYARVDLTENTYYGHCLNDKYHGYGTLLFSNGDSYEGYFENGCFNGTGIYCWRDESNRLKKVAISSFKDDKVYGDYIKVKVKQRIVVKGRRWNDIEIGLWRYYFENGDRMYKMYSDTGSLLWKHAICQNGAVVYVYHPTCSKNYTLLSIDYSNGDRYVARVINGIALGRFIRQSTIKTTINPFSSVKSSAAYYFKDITFTSVM